ncbi:hypothetical protein HYS48_04650 [Candidatus Woesearchaeota archaeon]|nr:hypothetical protein [Candidatus Woesearchaeota archaeon]
MVLFSLRELFDIVLMTLFVGYIFSGAWKRHRPHEHNYDPLEYYRKMKFGMDWHDLKFSMLVTAPAIIVHELLHKFIAMGFGMQAEFHAAYGWLMLGLILKLMNFGFIFFVPAYVSISGNGTALQFALTAFAGPFANLVLWLIPAFLLKQHAVPRKYVPLAVLTSRINMFLFIFNMLPIPGFDGSKVFGALLEIFF